jgi:hypothetical protein
MEESTDVSHDRNAPGFAVVDLDSCFLAFQPSLTVDLANPSTLMITALRSSETSVNIYLIVFKHPVASVYCDM